ncbi:MAG: toll/interleukin-1 receptor domain-containing protein [Erysipelotrichaceae bacterium]|nr:toll/interleukin-1 receptor domain-containing protein [Erysipelotrichaceae bacterium]MBQ6493154.1 toll/interleukin-1 receptor domain-containing protein [Erysipelotrichaceae bacterium]
MNADIFISYKSEEEEYARRVRKVLEDNGISCWMAPDSIPIGSNYMKQIPQAIESCKVMIVLVSEKSQQSTWVKNEFSQAISKNKLIIPYVIQDCKLEDEFAFSMSTMQQVFAWKNEEEALQRVVQDIRTALGDDPNARIEISVVRKPKIAPYVIGAALAVVALIAGFLLFNKGGKHVPVSATSAEVYYSEVIPYFMTGRLESVDDAMNNNYFNEDTYSRAFSLLSFIRNDSDKSVFVEKIACDIDEVVPIEVPVVHLDGFFEGDTFAAFAFNNGWGEAKNAKVTWEAEVSDGIPVYPELISALSGSKTVSINSGEAAEVYRIKVDLSELQAWCRERKDEYIPTLYSVYTQVEFDGGHDGFAMFLMYDSDNDSFFVDYGGADDEKPSVTLYAVLDVDNPPETLRFISEDANPLVEDTYRIETVIIPTKSCEVKLNGSYSIGGTLYETEDYDVIVAVPYFSDDAFEMGGYLTRDLYRIDMNNTSEMKKICQKYRYDIESILPDDAPRG